MLLYRIAKKEHIRDLSGVGARDHGGRWNHKGIPIVYTSETRALSTLEYLVHVDFTNLPTNLGLASIKVPDDIIPNEILISDLPADWREHPPPGVLVDIGTKWARSGQSLLLKVPSAIVVREYNVIINAAHPDLGRVAIIDVEDYRFDERLFL